MDWENIWQFKFAQMLTRGYNLKVQPSLAASADTVVTIFACSLGSI